MAPMLVTTVRLKGATKAELHRIIADSTAANRFIKAAQTALENYHTMRRLRDNTVSSPRRLESLRKAAQQYSNLLQALTLQDIRDLQQGCLPHHPNAALSIEQRLRESQEIAALLADGVIEALKLLRSGKGRRMDGLGIILIQTLAAAFHASCQRVGTADRSKFVQVIEVLSSNERLGFSDARQKVRTALNAGGNKYKKPAI